MLRRNTWEFVPWGQMKWWVTITKHIWGICSCFCSSLSWNTSWRPVTGSERGQHWHGEEEARLIPRTVWKSMRTIGKRGLPRHCLRATPTLGDRKPALHSGPCRDAARLLWETVPYQQQGFACCFTMVTHNLRAAIWSTSHRGAYTVQNAYHKSKHGPQNWLQEKQLHTFMALLFGLVSCEGVLSCQLI